MLQDKVIYKTIYGSKLYGTALPTSDTDYRGIFVPSPVNLILNKNIKDVYTSIENGIDTEYYSIQKFLKLLIDGNTPAFDMLYAAGMKENQNESNAIFLDYVWAKRHLFLSKKMGKFVNFARAQAYKYMDKAENLKEISDAIKVLLDFAPGNTLEEIQFNSTGWPIFYSDNVCFGKRKSVPCLYVFDKTIPMNKTVAETYEVMANLQDKFGSRVKNLTNSDGIDTKAAMHCIRVCWELRELIRTGELVFPLKRSDELLDIRQGKWEDGREGLIAMLEIQCSRAESKLEACKWPEECSVNTDKIIMNIYSELGLYNAPNMHNVKIGLTDPD